MNIDIKIASFSMLQCLYNIVHYFILKLEKRLAEKLPCLRPKESFISIIPYSPSVGIFRDKNIIILLVKRKKKKKQQKNCEHSEIMGDPDYNSSEKCGTNWIGI